MLMFNNAYDLRKILASVISGEVYTIHETTSFGLGHICDYDIVLAPQNGPHEEYTLFK